MTLGLGVMINMLGGRHGGDKLQAAVGKPISRASFENDALSLFFEDGSGIRLHDDGQSCCESRYMQTDDDVSWLVGKTFAGLELRDAPSIGGPDDEPHEVQFMAVKTDQGEIVFASHVEHNGYYGGFSINCVSLGEPGDDLP